MSRDDALPLAPVTPDGLGVPAGLTPARLSLGRAGSGMPTRAVLSFGIDHAQARDAVHATVDAEALGLCLDGLGLDIIAVESAAPDRETYLRRPDFGRRLSRASRTVLAARPRVERDVVFVVADGLSARAVTENAAPTLHALVPLLGGRNMSVGPIVLASQARVALGDEVGALLGARLVVVLVGERPGLSAADSLGAYLTFAPKLGRSDAERNCVSNIRAAGLPPAEAAGVLAWLIERAFKLGLTGVQLKDESGGGMASLPQSSGPACRGSADG